MLVVGWLGGWVAGWFGGWVVVDIVDIADIVDIVDMFSGKKHKRGATKLSSCPGSRRP